MEALHSLISGQLPPAGEPIVWATPERYEPEPKFPGYQVTWVNSGTSALALALLAIRQRRPDVSHPEVVVPGYACPDLVSAALYAGLRPVVVDINHADPSYHLKNLEPQLSKHTLAVVAVNFLGIREPLGEVRALIRRYPWITLIEDNAQWFPHESETDQLMGDMIVFSFGRGKPVSLLGGGALLSKRKLADWIPDIPNSDSSSAGITRFKYLSYNLLLKPRLYQMLNRVPFTRLGETRYVPLDSIYKLDSYRARILTANIQAYHSSEAPATKAYDRLLSNYNGLRLSDTSRRMRLLRYPMVCHSKEERDRLLRLLTREGLGASAMYRRPLVQIPGAAPHLKVTHELPNALDFADRLLTLPVHRGVTERHWEKIARIFRDCATPY